MDGSESELAIAVAKKLKECLDLHRREDSVDVSQIGKDDLKVHLKNFKNSKKNGQVSKAKILLNEVKSMQSMTQLTEKEIATKKKLEIQMARHNNPFILSPYACPVGDDNKRIHKLMKKRAPKKRIVPTSRIQSASSTKAINADSPGKNSNSEREQILNLTAKLLVATETVALPKNRHQSRESQTSTEEYFPSIPPVSLIHGARAKSSYSDPGIHTLTKERVEKLNSPRHSRKELKDEICSVDSGSLNIHNQTPFRVESCTQGYVVRKKPASYPSSLTSQNSRLSPHVPALSNNYTVIKDKPDDLESFDDDYFDNELTGHNRASPNTDWFEGTREKQLADTSTQTIQNRGTQTCKQKADSFDDFLPSTVSAKNHSPHRHNTIATQIQQSFDALSDNSSNELVQSPESANFSIQTQTNFDPKVITYQIYVITGDVASASTNADVKINVFGERGDSGDRSLLKSKSSTVPFQRGQIDSFDIDCKFLGKLTNIRVGHNGTSADAGWFLEKVHIKPGQKATKAYTFICNKWLSAREGDGQIIRDVTLSQETPLNELPPILPRKALRCRETDEETVMSEVHRPKLLKSKATRDKLNNDKGYDEKDSNKSKDKKKHGDKKDRHKHNKLHRKLSSSSSNTVSSSSDTDTEQEKLKLQKQKRHERHSHKNSNKHVPDKPQASLSGKINSVTKKTKKLDVEDVYSTDTSISSHISSAYERSLNEMKAAAYRDPPKKSKNKKKTELEPINKRNSVKDSFSDSQSPKKEKLKDIDSRRASLEPPHITYSSHEISDNQNDGANEERIEKKGKKHNKKVKKDIPDDEKSKKVIVPPIQNGVQSKKNRSSPVHSQNSAGSPKYSKKGMASPLPPRDEESPLKSAQFIESVIIPQIAEMVHAAGQSDDMNEGENSEVSSVESSGEMNNNITHETEEEKVEFSLKDTKKQVSGGTGYPMKLLMNSYSLLNDAEYPADSDKDDPYMAGFRAGMSATKSKDKNKDSAEDQKYQKLRNGPTIHQACEDGDLDRMKELIDAIPDIKHKPDERGWAPIHISAAFGHLDLLKWLSISGVNLSEETQTGYTPIHLAAMNGHVNCIMILSAMGCSISARTVDQFTPLHLAAMSGHIECVKWLLSNRAKIDATDANGRTPLDLAEEYQHEECQKLLSILGQELKRKGSAIAILNNPYALRRNSSTDMNDSPVPEDLGDESEGKNWLSDAEETSDVVGRGGDERPESQRRNSGHVGRRNSAAKRGSVSHLPPRPNSRRMSKQEERQVQQLEEKKRIYTEQRRKLERRNSSFLDSIRQDIDGVEEQNF